MKKYTLIILIASMVLNAFCLTQEEKDKIYDAIIAEAKRPSLLTPSSFRSDRSSLGGELAIGFTNLSSKAAREMLKDSNKLNAYFEEVEKKYSKELAVSRAFTKDKEEAEKAAEYLSSLPPSIIIPAYYELALEGKLRTNVYYYSTVLSPQTNKYDESSYLCVINKIPIVKKKADLRGAGAEHLIHCGQTYLEGSLIKMVDPKVSYVGHLEAYWWLEGRRFMPEIWNDWYPCWKNEMAREEPRELIVKRLISDIACFGTYLFPYLNDAIKEGDDSLATVLEAVKYKTRVDLTSVNDFCEWYSTNHFKYDYPPCEGIRKTMERITDPYILSELKGEDTYDAKEKYGDKWAFGDLEREVFKQILWKAEDYYNNREYPPNYWYYKLPDEAKIERSVEIDRFDRANKINERFIKKLEKKQK